MSSEEIKKLGEKIADGTNTAEEKLAFVKELNIIVQNLQKDITEIKNTTI